MNDEHDSWFSSRAATLYRHFKSKEELIDKMAIIVLAQGARHLISEKYSADWNVWTPLPGRPQSDGPEAHNLHPASSNEGPLDSFRTIEFERND